MHLKKLILVAAVAGALGAGPAAAPAVSAERAHAACKQAKIAGKRKCIARGQYCSRTARAMRDYRRYGFSCTKRDYRGRYHLR